MFSKTQHVFDHVSIVAVWIAGAALLATAFMVGLEVILRKLFNTSLGGADEISGYVFAAATTWSYAAVLRKKGNVRIDVFYNLLPLPGKIVLDIVSFLMLGALFVLIGWFGFELVLNTINTGRISVTPLRTPLAIPQIAWISGIGLALLMWLLIAIRVAGHAMRRNWPAVSELIGAEGADSEVDAELAGELEEPRDEVKA
ncbi:TRAP-type C4-dicarboxylate transport system permease small subunit [Labrenzia sp. EL_126]|nr:TRAP-type C4-dicarboxylate transport system permease small subunit [Labrenzia sp. EL_126]